MLPSNSRLQRLSQAALSRSQFLQLAAGALLPFVGLPPSAAADKNSELAQKGGALGTKDAAASGRMGAILVSQFGPVKIHSYLSPLDGIADQLRARGQARLDSFRPIYGDRIATKVTVPTEIIAEGVQRIDGITYDFRRFVDAESDLQLAALLPEQKMLMAFDLVFSPNEHAFTVVDHFDHWMIVLEQLKALQDYDTITI